MTDPVNHPAHYLAHPSGVECIDVTQCMSFCLGNAVKYLWRHGSKGNAAQDLEKARWYVGRVIAMRDDGELTAPILPTLAERNALTYWLRHEPPSSIRAAVTCIWDADRGVDTAESLRAALGYIEIVIAGLKAASL